MAQSIIAPFIRQFAAPIEEFRQVADITARDAISPSRRWEGMQVYVLQTETTYELKGGITNSDWVQGGGGLTDIEQNGKVTTFTLPDTTQIEIDLNSINTVISNFNVLKRFGNIDGENIETNDKIEGWEDWPDRTVWIEGVVLDATAFSLPSDLRDTDKFFITNEQFRIT